MIMDAGQELSMPGRTERQRILERAGLILAQARSLRDQLDRFEGGFALAVYAGAANEDYSRQESRFQSLERF